MVMSLNPGDAGVFAPPSGSRPRVAALCTVYRPRSHADVIVSKLLGDYSWPHVYDRDALDYGETVRTLTETPLPTDIDGRIRRPRVDVASMFIDQFPENDLSRGWSERTGVPILPSIRDAITLGTDTIAVNGVLIIGEHGEYPLNARGQRLYPRRAWFDAVADVFEELGSVVPVFIDKHLGVGWEDARAIVDRAARLGIPLMAGSSVSTAPVSWRSPRVDIPIGTQIHQAVVVSPPPLEAYGFHALEALQCIMERRHGGESGIASVQCLVGQDAWTAMDRGAWDQSLMQAALQVCDRATPGDARSLAPDASAFLITYRDGTRAMAMIPETVTPQWAIAADVTLPGADTVSRIAFRFGMGTQEPFSHFAWLIEGVQDMIETGVPTVPAVRTLLTTGALDFLMASHEAGGVPIDTPQLHISYAPSATVEK